MRPDVKSQTRAELQAQFAAWGEPSYRADQLLDWLYARRAVNWGEMTNLPRLLRQQLAEHYSLGALELVAKQGTSDGVQKFLWRLNDLAMIESVLIPANPALYGEPSDRRTLCISTQVGCAYGCKFCASGLAGWKRNLRPEEMVEQALALERWHAQNNLVIMGMGEPLANYDALLRALQILNAPWGAGIGARKITISTCGLAPQIRRLADEPQQFRLALSLHGATDAVRSKLMPVNRKYPLGELVAACEYYIQKKGKIISLEYILIAGVNDRLDDIKALAELARRLQAKVNLIPYNIVDGLPWQPSAAAVQNACLTALKNCKIAVTLRREKGQDIDAACGQLRLKTEIFLD
jgi:23S rRNA (adenine2503-C2)-methyltransferase